MKKLSAFLLSLAIASPGLSQEDEGYYDFKKMTIEKVVAKAGNSRILTINLPACTVDGKCDDFPQKVLFNCATTDVYSLGFAPLNSIGQPRLNDFFERSDNLIPGIPKFKTACSRKPEFDRVHVWVSEDNRLEGYLLISDTLKKNKNIVTVWIETKKFEKVLSRFFTDTKPEDIKDWMYTFEPKSNSPSTKIHWKYDCANRTSSTLTEIT
jgi:hypothetical protein